MQTVLISDQESLRCHLLESRKYFPEISTIRIFLNLLFEYERKYNKLSNNQRIDFLHDLYLISGAK